MTSGIPLPTINKEVSVGNILSMITILIGVFTLYVGITKSYAEFAASNAAFQTEVQSRFKEMDTNRAVFLPILQNAAHENELQNNRLDRQADTIIEMRGASSDAFADIRKSMLENFTKTSDAIEKIRNQQTEILVSLSELKTRLRDRPGGPR